MRILHLAAGLFLALAAIEASAHAHLKDSNPKEGALVTEMPASISLTFSESARITTVSLQKDQEPKKTLIPPTAAGARLTVEVPSLVPGAYTLRWRVASTDDNHIASGELRFTFAPMPR